MTVLLEVINTASLVIAAIITVIFLLSSLALFFLPDTVLEPPRSAPDDVGASEAGTVVALGGRDRRRAAGRATPRTQQAA